MTMTQNLQTNNTILTAIEEKKNTYRKTLEKPFTVKLRRALSQQRKKIQWKRDIVEG